jgi:putative ABC transport system permease protein
MSSRWKKVWADFWSNKGRTLLTIMTIMVGTFAVGFNSNLGLYMNESMDKDYLSALPSEAEVYTSSFDDDAVKMARSVPGVNGVEGTSSVSARILRPDGTYVDIQFTALKDPKEQTLNLLKPAAGEVSIPVYGDRETIIDASALSLGYKPGDFITIELDDGKHRDVKLAGYTHAVTGYPYGLAKTVFAYVTPKTLEWLGGGQNYDMLAVSIAENPTDSKHVTEVAQAVADRMERAGKSIYFVNVYQPGHHFAWSITQGVFFVLGVLGYLTVLLSCFLIVNTVTALMTQQTRQIGIMKAVGGDTLQIAGMYTVLILGFGLGALLMAIPLANMAAEYIGGGMAEWLNFYTDPYVGYQSSVIQQVIVALVVPLLAAIHPIYNSVRVTVREALSDYGLGGRAKPRNDSVSKNATLIARPIRISIRNTFRRRTRLILTLFTLVLGGAVFIGVYNLWASFDKVIEDIQGYFLADINLSFGHGYRFDKVSAMAESVPGVSSVEGWLEYPGTLKMGSDDDTGTQILFVAPPSTSTLIDPIITSGRWLKPGDENAIVIGNHLLNMFPDLKVGDWLTIEINGKETKWHIIGTYSITGNVNPPLLYVNYEYISRLIGEPGQVYSLRVLTTDHSAATQTLVNNRLQALFKERGVQVTSTQLGTQFIEDQKAQTDILVYFMLVMASLIAVVGGLGLMGTMSINVLERTREIGVMRAIGASNWDIQTIVLVEGMVIGILSWAISILVSLPITNVLCYGVGMAILTAPMPAVYGVSGILAWLLFTVVLGSLASALPARRASKLTVRDTLAYE